MLGDLSEREKNVKKAEFYYSKAIKADPGLTIAYRKLAQLYQTSGEKAKARTYWQSVLRINPQDKDAKYYLDSVR
jgi:tetratricopeptide (TPR) repeat protein